MGTVVPVLVRPMGGLDGVATQVSTPLSDQIAPVGVPINVSDGRPPPKPRARQPAELRHSKTSPSPLWLSDPLRFGQKCDDMAGASALADDVTPHGEAIRAAVDEAVRSKPTVPVRRAVWKRRTGVGRVSSYCARSVRGAILGLLKRYGIPPATSSSVCRQRNTDGSEGWLL